MKSLSLCCFTFAGILALAISRGQAAEPSKVIELWPGGAPGEKGNLGEEKDTTKPTDQLIAGGRIIKLANVSRPTISFHRPPVDKDTNPASSLPTYYEVVWVVRVR